MAGEDRHYTDFVRSKPCAACGTMIGVQAHHALYGTTYSPDEPIPTKAIPNARKGASQKSHDYFSIPLCYKDHTPGLHKGNGYFEGKSGAWIEAWERSQVEEMHRLYDAEFPQGAPVNRAVQRGPSAAPKSRDATDRERARIVNVIRARAAERHHLPDQHQLLSELADDIAAGANDTGAF